jgi:hypothetical protein
MSKLYQTRRAFLSFNKNVLAKVSVFSFLLVGLVRRVYAQDFFEAIQVWDALDPRPDIQSAFNTLYNILLPLSILVGLVLLGINGYGLMTSDGDPRKVQTAKEGIFSAVTGLAFVILAMVIYNLIIKSLLDAPGF